MILWHLWWKFLYMSVAMSTCQCFVSFRVSVIPFTWFKNTIKKCFWHWEPFGYKHRSVWSNTHCSSSHHWRLHNPPPDYSGWSYWCRSRLYTGTRRRCTESLKNTNADGKDFFCQLHKDFSIAYPILQYRLLLHGSSSEPSPQSSVPSHQELCLIQRPLMQRR